LSDDEESSNESVTSSSNSQDFTPADHPVGSAISTTVIVRNLPNRCTRSSFLNLVDSRGFKGTYDFVYVPIDFRTKACVGYSFMNFVSVAAAELFRAEFSGFAGWFCQSQKVCDVLFTDVNDTLASHIARYRNSGVMHHSVPDEFKPATFKGGDRIAFPPPTRFLRKPQILRGKN